MYIHTQNSKPTNSASPYLQQGTAAASKDETQKRGIVCKRVKKLLHKYNIINIIMFF